MNTHRVLGTVAVLALGGALVARWTVAPHADRPTPIVPVAVDPPVAEDTALPEEVRALAALEAEVADLEADLNAREASLSTARRELSRVRADRADVAEDLARLRASVSETRDALAAAVAARDELVASLVEATRAREEAEVARDGWRYSALRWEDRAVDARWEAFVADAVLTVCDRGPRQRQARCRGALRAQLVTPEAQRSFAACVRDGGALPVVTQVGEAGAPDTATVLASDRRLPGGPWAVAWCDPALPEAGDDGAAGL